MTTEDSDQTDELEGSPKHAPLLASSTVNDLEKAAATLMVEEPENQLQDWLPISSVLMMRTKEICRMIEMVAIEWIKLNGAIRVGDIEYTVGHQQVVRCTDIRRCVTMVLEASGGDIAGISDRLRSDPFKYGSVRSLIGRPLFNQVFRTETNPKLLYGTPQLQLLRANLRFLPSRSSKIAAVTEPSK